MNELDAYQRDAFRTSGMQNESGETLAIAALGITGEAGEVADIVKKVIGHGHKLDRDRLVDELGDVLWYVAVMSSLLGVTLSKVAGRNIRKLKERYPDGFDEERSRERKPEEP